MYYYKKRWFVDTAFLQHEKNKIIPSLLNVLLGNSFNTKHASNLVTYSILKPGNYTVHGTRRDYVYFRGGNPDI